MIDREAADGWVVVMAAEQRRLDALAVTLGVPGDDLVESAGRAAADRIVASARLGCVAVLAGPGGNGADALVVARRLREAGHDVVTFLFLPRGAPSPSVEHALRLLIETGGVIERLGSGSLAAAEAALSRADLVIDGLYGSGLSRPLDGAAAEIVRLVNGCKADVVSLDVPSGILADNGEVAGPAVKATTTLAMEFLKPAHLLFPAAGLCGEVAVVPVAYPAEAREGAIAWARVLDRASVRRRLPPRPPAGHKGTFGHVLLVAGSVGMVGAAILAGRASLRSGAGLLTVGIPASQAATVHAALPEALVVSLAEERGHITPAGVESLGAALGRATVLAMGPGLSRDEETSAAVLAALRAFGGPVVVDADAIYALSRSPETLGTLAGRAILTPHPGEFAFLSGMSVADVDRDRVAVAPDFARRSDVIAILKGRPTAIGLPDGRTYLNPTGNAGLAKGGSGDVLTGIVAGLVAAGASLEDAALVGPYVHGLAADLFAIAGSERSLLPSDVVDLLPQTLREVERCE